ncbi:exosome 3'-_5 exonuclease subunit ski4 (Csl4) [Orbilia oligospora]|nr:exosome 3'->5 exonuclease subunit ski4 (Csl4) [Orbilia oligospora]
MTSLVVPGQPLGPVNAYIPGPGVHVFNGQIIASLVGQVVTNPQTTTTTTTSTSTSTAVPPTISVQKPVLTTDEEANATLLPEVSSTVLCRITRINPRQATASIFIVNNHICGDEFQGVIRVQDVRLTEVDKSNYYLSTASNELGVIMADSEMGDPMYPINWKEMKSTRTGVVEERKVAKPF